MFTLFDVFWEHTSAQWAVWLIKYKTTQEKITTVKLKSKISPQDTNLIWVWGSHINSDF